MKVGGWSGFGLLHIPTHSCDRLKSPMGSFQHQKAAQPDVECALVSKSAFLSLQLV